MATASDLLWGLPSAELEDEQLQQPCFSCLPAGKPSPGIPGVLPHAEALPVVLTCASHSRTHTQAANPSLSDGVGTTSEAGTEKVWLVFNSALRLQ